MLVPMREFDLLQHIYEASSDMGGAIVVPPGDDMAVINVGGAPLLLAVDQLVDGRHVQLEHTPIELVGRKAITRCLSDVAAMASEPVASLAAVVLPTGLGGDRAQELFQAMRRTAEALACPLVGGDIAVHESDEFPLTLSVTAVSKAAAHPPVLRSGAQVGDDVYVTGRLGGAWNDAGGGHHLTFAPRISEALELSAQLGDRLHALIDLSDGLGRDAGHIAERSGAAIELFADQLPCNDGCDWRRALGDGEDYELCFTATGDVPDRIGDVPISRIGRVIDAAQARADRPEGLVWISVDDKWCRVASIGWQHESPP